MLRLYIKLFLALAYAMGSCSQNVEKQLVESSPETDSVSAKNQIHQEIMTEADKADTLEDTVFMKADRNIIKRSELDQPITLTITNNKYEEVMTGEHYTIEKLEEEEWRMIPEDRFFDDLGYIFKKGSSIDFDIQLLTDDYRYEPGRYRIVKGYSVKVEEYKYDEYEVYSEITVE